jgi:hypothetical protein
MAALNPFLVVMDMAREAQRQRGAKDRAKLSIRHGACNECDDASKSGRRRDGGPRSLGGGEGGGRGEVGARHRLLLQPLHLQRKIHAEVALGA